MVKEADVKSEKITPNEWQWVSQLLRDLEAESSLENVNDLLRPWVLAVRSFRRAELKNMIEVEPREVDLLHHKRLVTILISLGANLSLVFHRHNTQQSLSPLDDGFVRSMLQDLEDSYLEWHAPVDQRRVKDLAEKIFHGAA